ncbi:MAG: hypothetical protein PHT07_18475 [Paludibacter sp.]|nr:hypothetical protein [Paludibacter sp.]
MKSYLRLLFVSVISFFLVIQVSAQDTDTIAVKKSSFVVGLKYLSNNVYLGRIDSANIMYLVPSIGYAHKSGLHIGASLAYQLDAGLNKIDAIALEGGYDFKIGSKFSGGLSVEKYFFDMNSISLNSMTDLGVGSNFAYDFDIVTLNASAGLGFNEKVDVITEIGITKSFEFGKFAVEPVIKLFAGTQNYYNQYLKAGKSHLSGNKGHGKGSTAAKGKSGMTTTTTTAGTVAATYTVAAASAYKVLDYELSIPIAYTFQNLKFDLVPTYAIPVNAATILSSTGAVVKEAISNRFILQVGATYTFK